jgi:putative ABC transport system permease protein
MIKNYFKIAFANLIKSKVYSLISISSLTIGMAISILLLIYVADELSYDRYHENADNIYRLCREKESYQAPQTAKILADKLPQIEKHARIFPNDNFIVQYKEQKFNENMGAFADNELFQIFSFKFKYGNAETALTDPASIVISEKIAQKYFGKENPIGKVLKINNEFEGTISAVIENMPHNSHFRYDIIFSLAGANMLFGEEMMNNRSWQNFLVYFQMQSEFSKLEIEKNISEQMKDPNDAEAPLPIFELQKLKDIHLYSSHIKNDIQPQNSIMFVMIFSAIGLLILLIACFNYINLLTANATTRVTEIGVRKTFGASRTQLAKQFISESIVVLFISLVLALLVVGLSLPIFNTLSSKELSLLSLINGNIILGILGMVLLVGVIAGWYPAFVLSSFNPTKVMKASKSSGGSKIQFKKILVGAQFTIVIALIASAIIMLRQTNFIQNTALGFDKEYVLVANVNDIGDEGKYLSLKQALLEQSIVSSVSTASRVPSGELNNGGAAIPEGQTEWIDIRTVHVQFDYFKTLGIKAKQGRLFSDQLKTDITESLILNEAAVKHLGIQGDPIGQEIKCAWPRSDRKIVGIVDDFHFESLHEKIKPVLFVIFHDMCSRLIVKVNPSNASDAINILRETSQKIYPEEIFDFRFMDVRLEQLYKKDENTFQLMGYFAAIAILLACMGLLGMASFILTRRTKEIGVRKVNGATVFEIVQMLNISFVRWIVISFAIATPIAYYGMNKWLENFAYKTELSWWIFVLAGFISLVVVLLTVSGLSYKAARRNPVEALRFE